MKITCTVNGKPASADDVWAGESMLSVLRERLGLFGSKNACEQGECGSCSVLLEGSLVCSCLVLAAALDDARGTTVEGFAEDPVRSRVQDAPGEAGGVPGGLCH